MILPRRSFLTSLAGLIAAPAVLSSEDPSEWSESDWRIAKAEAALPPYHRTMAGELYLALRTSLPAQWSGDL